MYRIRVLLVCLGLFRVERETDVFRPIFVLSNPQVSKDQRFLDPRVARKLQNHGHLISS